MPVLASAAIVSAAVTPVPVVRVPAASGAGPTAGPQPVPANRRHLLRLRDLCDEVLASHRAARARDVISEPERQDARALLAGLAPERRG